MPDTIIELGQGPIERPSDTPRMGDRREVYLVPTPWQTYAPCLWKSPRETTTEDGVKGRWCVVLIDKGALDTGKPQTAAMFVPDVLWDKLPKDVVEW